jgi:WD40 repeat protein
MGYCIVERETIDQWSFPKVENGEWGQITAVRYSPDGKLLALAGGYSKPRYDSVKLWDVNAGKVILELQGHTDTILGLVFTPDGKHLITGSFDHSINVWDIATGKQITSWIAHDSVIRHLAISPSGKLLASCGGDHFARVWDLEKIIETK